MSKKLPVRWSLKKGDKILYRTPKGNVKTFIYGEQTWHGAGLPTRIFRYFRGKLEYRRPTISEILNKVMPKYTKGMEAAFSQPHPFLEALNFDWKQSAIAVHISGK